MDTTAALLYNRFDMVPNRAWNIFLSAVNAISSIPVERMLVPRQRSSQGALKGTALPEAETANNPGSSPSIQRVPVICVWCAAERKAKGLPPKILGYVMMKVPSVVKDPTSDGICAECETKYFPGINTSASPLQNPESLPAAKAHDAVEIAHRATSGHPQALTREGTLPERIAYQEGEMWANLWLLEGHLKQACGNCGGDEECCAKHSAALVALARETQSMTTDPRLDQVIELAQEVFPKVQSADVKASTYVSEYPALAVKVSAVRNRFTPPHEWVMGERVRLEEAKAEAARIAAEEVEKQWHSATPK